MVFLRGVTVLIVLRISAVVQCTVVVTTIGSHRKYLKIDQWNDSNFRMADHIFSKVDPIPALTEIT